MATSTARSCARAGYGDISPNDCWLANTVITVQSVYALLQNALVLGVVFARISRPGQRGRTIFLSDSAVVARRDGELKFMLRVADIRPRYQATACPPLAGLCSCCSVACFLSEYLLYSYCCLSKHRVRLHGQTPLRFSTSTLQFTRQADGLNNAYCLVRLTARVIKCLLCLGLGTDRFENKDTSLFKVVTSSRNIYSKLSVTMLYAGVGMCQEDVIPFAPAFVEPKSLHRQCPCRW